MCLSFLLFWFGIKQLFWFRLGRSYLHQFYEYVWSPETAFPVVYFNSKVDSLLNVVVACCIKCQCDRCLVPLVLRKTRTGASLVWLLDKWFHSLIGLWPLQMKLYIQYVQPLNAGNIQHILQALTDPKCWTQSENNWTVWLKIKA